MLHISLIRKFNQRQSTTLYHLPTNVVSVSNINLCFTNCLNLYLLFLSYFVFLTKTGHVYLCVWLCECSYVCLSTFAMEKFNRHLISIEKRIKKSFWERKLLFNSSIVFFLSTNVFALSFSVYCLDSSFHSTWKLPEDKSTLDHPLILFTLLPPTLRC